MEKWVDTIYFTMIACIGGCVSYLSGSKEFSLKEFLIKGISSGFTGASMTAFLCGTFGYVGSEVTINLLKRIIIKKINSI